MSARRLASVFVVLLALMLVATIPLSLALSAMGAATRGLSATRVSGTIWSGELSDASFQRVRLGDVRVRLDPLGLFLGGGRVQFVLGGRLQGRGVARLAGREVGVSRLRLSAPADALADGLPFRGTVRLENLEARFRSGACHRASGRIVLERLSLGAGAPLPGLSLSGPAACRGGLLVAPLSGRAAGVEVEADLQVSGAGRYQLLTRVKTTDPTLEAAMGLAGFERNLDGFNRRDHGQVGVDAPR